MVCGKAVPPCPVQTRSANGWPRLALWQHGSASEGDQLVYEYNGTVYKESTCNHVNYTNLEGTSHPKPRSIPCAAPPDFLVMLKHDLEHKTYLRHLRACLEQEGKRLPVEANLRIGGSTSISMTRIDLYRVWLCNHCTRAQPGATGRCSCTFVPAKVGVRFFTLGVTHW